MEGNQKIVLKETCINIIDKISEVVVSGCRPKGYSLKITEKKTKNTYS